MKALIRIPNRPDDPPTEVIPTVKRVYERAAHCIDGNRVDREITARQVTDEVRPMPHRRPAIRCRILLGTIRCNLDVDAVVKDKADRAEPLANGIDAVRAGRPTGNLRLIRRRVGGIVEVADGDAEEQVAYTATDQKQLVATRGKGLSQPPGNVAHRQG